MMAGFLHMLIADTPYFKEPFCLFNLTYVYAQGSKWQHISKGPGNGYAPVSLQIIISYDATQ